VVLRGPGDDPEVLVVHRPAYDDWSLPKGKLEPGESAVDGACRELLEETGVEGRPGAHVGRVEYRDQRGRPKVVDYFRMDVVAESPRDPDDEVDRVEWWPLARARAELTYGHDRDLVGAL
jgi:8-oxo-dGTP diphosphatase